MVLNKVKYKFAKDGSSHSELFLKIGVPDRHSLLEIPVKEISF